MFTHSVHIIPASVGSLSKDIKRVKICRYVKVHTLHIVYTIHSYLPFIQISAGTIAHDESNDYCTDYKFIIAPTIYRRNLLSRSKIA